MTTARRPAGYAVGGVFATFADLLAYDNAVRGHRLLARQWPAWVRGDGAAAEVVARVRALLRRLPPPGRAATRASDRAPRARAP